MKTKAAVILFISATSVLAGEGIGEPAPALPALVNAVINECHITYEVRSVTDIRKTTVYRATVLNQGGRNYGKFRAVVDNDSRISSFNGTITKADGTVSDKIRITDLKDVPFYPDFVFATDDRLYYYEPVIQDYPYTLTYETVISYSGLIAFETWTPVDNLNLACDTASYTIIFPDGYNIRYRSFNIPDKPVTGKPDGNRSLISWGIGHIEPIELKNFIPSLESFLPYLMVMPEKFCYDGHTGEFSDARSYGSWIAGLLADREELNPVIRAQMAALTSDATGTKEKVRRIYRFLQENTRYVAIAFGIGGIQPAPADKVLKYGYGDCKGLSNFMRSLLASVGIRSYYAEIGNGNMKILYDDFTYLQTNHVVLCVPDANDTIWLECTSQYYDAGYLGYSNSNRKALLITGEGGILVNTPRADSSNSYRNAKYELKIGSDGSSEYKIITEATGHYYEDLLYIKHFTRDQALKYLYRELPLRNHTITDFEAISDTSRIASLKASFQGKLNKYGTIAGKRLIVPVIPCKMFESVPKLEADRKVPFHIPENTACIDTITIKIPDAYKTAALAETREFSNEFGRYRQSIRSDGSDLLVIREVVMPAGTFPAEERDKLTEFFKKCHDLEAISAMYELAD